MRRGSAITLTGALLVSITSWLFAASHPGHSPAFPLRADPPADLVVTDAQRHDALVRASVRLRPTPGIDRAALGPAGGAGRDSPTVCDFVSDTPSGTSPKFTCVLPDGELVKVKYGHNPEIFAEAAATHLLTALGYAADSVDVVTRLRCYGCSRFPFLALHMRKWPGLAHLILPRYDGYTDFDTVAVERRFHAPAIETGTTKGWGWWELKDSTADPADIDAMRLLALFLAHWDNKAENQRLVCQEQGAGERGQGECPRPLLMIQDLGGTFGPFKVNLHAWAEAPIWRDARRCVVSMRTLPFGGSTFPDAQISEDGRQRLLAQLQALTDGDIRTLFASAAFPAYQSPTDDERDLEEWTRAFQSRVRMIGEAGPCP